MKSNTDNNKPVISRAKWIRSAIAGLIVPAVIMILCGGASAQQTAQELKMACETNPGNVVAINQSTKISGGANVNSPCTVVLANDVALDFEDAYMGFNGPLTLQSSGKANVKFTRSSFSGISLTVNLAGVGSGLSAESTTLHAAAGDLTLSFGHDSKMEIAERNFHGIGSDGLFAAGRIQIRGGRKFTGSIAGKIAPFTMRAPLGISIAMNGEEGLLKMDKVVFYAEQNNVGRVDITSTGAKSMVEMSSTGGSIEDAFVIRLEGAESTIKIKQMGVGTGDGGISSGGITFEAGTGGAGGGKIEVSEFRNGDIASVTMAASRNGLNGAIKVEKSSIGARTGDLLIETGAQGSTDVKENRLFSATRIRIATGAGGSCNAQPNELFAPVVEACP